MRTLVFEQWQGGHYFNYLECLIPRLASMSDEVVVAITADAARSKPFATQLGHLGNLPNVRFDLEVPVPRERSRLAFRARLGRNVVDAIVRNEPDHVFLPSADEQLIALPLLAMAEAGRRMRGVPIEAVVHYKAYTSSASSRDRLVSSLQRRLLAAGTFARLSFVNFLQYEDASRSRPPLSKMARAAGDPVPSSMRVSRPEARRALGLPADGRYVGMVGELDARKAVQATLAAFRSAGLPRSDRLLLAGRLASRHSELIHQEHQDLVADGRLIVIDRFLDNDELGNCFAALDVHCSLYESFSGLSSLMLKSIAAGVPVIANDFGWGAAVVRRFEVGHTASANRIDALAQVLRQALDVSGDYKETAAVERLLQFHSSANFVEGLVEPACIRAGRPAERNVLPWSWVLEALPAERRQLR